MFVEERQHEGLRLREFDLERDGRPVTGVLWSSPEAAPGAPLVCLGHGASGDRFQQPIPWLAKRLVGEHGFFALAIDGPVHGRRQVGEGGRTAFWPEWDREGSVEDMTADWRQALEFAQAQPDVGAGPVGYWGLSMGTIYGAPFVAAEPRVRAAVLGLMGVTGPVHYRPRVRAAAQAITCPLLFLVQLEDELFSRSECLALFDAFASTDKRLHANPGLHPAVPVGELHASLEHLVQSLTGGRPQPESAFAVSR
ncbi:MAG: alpha/beta hydrolase [Acidimicrobiales bacterium]